MDADGRAFFEAEAARAPEPGSRGPPPPRSASASSTSASAAVVNRDVAARLAPYATLVDGALYVRTRAGAALRLNPDPRGDPRTLLLTGAGGVRFSLTLGPNVPVENDPVGVWRRAFADPQWEDALEPV